MWHLSPEVLLDLAEGTQPERAVSHLATCERCQRRLAELREALAAARMAHEVPEPSPLFWDHLSARVRDAVAADVAAPRPWTAGWASWPRSAWIGSVVGLVFVLGVWQQIRLDRQVRDRNGQVDFAGPSQVRFADAGSGAQASTEGSFGFVADLAEGLAENLDWETEAGLTTRVGAIDGAMNELSSEERTELSRLLNEALAKRGA